LASDAAEEAASASCCGCLLSISHPEGVPGAEAAEEGKDFGALVRLPPPPGAGEVSFFCASECV